MSIRHIDVHGLEQVLRCHVVLLSCVLIRRLCFRKIHSNKHLLLLCYSDVQQVLPTLSSMEEMQSNTLAQELQSIDYSDNSLPCGSHEVNKKFCKSSNFSPDHNIIGYESQTVELYPLISISLYFYRPLKGPDDESGCHDLPEGGHVCLCVDFAEADKNFGCDRSQRNNNTTSISSTHFIQGNQ